MSLNESTRWGVGILAALALQTFSVGWYLATLNAQVNQNSQAISELRTGATVYLTREQLEDILGARDQRLSNIEGSVSRIEKKLDAVIGQ